MPRRFTSPYHGMPIDIFTSDTPGVRRLQVDVGQTGFFAGREFRVFKELAIGATPYYARFTVPSTLAGVYLQALSLSCYQGSIALRAWRVGTPDGVWTQVPIWPNNAIPDVPGYERQATVEDGGTVSGLSMQSDALIVYANETGKSQTTAQSILHGERGLPAGTFYLEFSRLPGTTVDGLGVFAAVWEERPPEDPWTL